MGDTFSPLYARYLVLHNVPVALRTSERLLAFLHEQLSSSGGVRVLRWHSPETALLYMPSAAATAEALQALDGATRLSEAFRQAHEGSHPLGALPTGAGGGSGAAGPRPTTDSSVAARLIKGALGPQRHKMGAAARTDPASTGAGYLRPNAPLPSAGGSGRSGSLSTWRSGEEEGAGGAAGEGAAAAAAVGAEAAGAGPAVRGRGEPLWRAAGAAGSGGAAPAAQLQQPHQHRLAERGSAGPSMASKLKTIALGWGPQPGAVTASQGSAAAAAAAAAPSGEGASASSKRISQALAAAAAAAAAVAAGGSGAARAPGGAQQQRRPLQPPPPHRPAPVVGSLSSLEEDESTGFAWADVADEEDAGAGAPGASASASTAAKPRRPLVLLPTASAFVPGKAGGAPAQTWEKNPAAKEFVPGLATVEFEGAAAPPPMAGHVQGSFGGFLYPPLPLPLPQQQQQPYFHPHQPVYFAPTQQHF